MARKNIRLNYFEAMVIPAKIALQEDLKEVRNEEQEEIPYAGAAWNATGMLDFLSANQDFDTSYSLGEEYAEVEKNSHIVDHKLNLHSFQLCKLRDRNIPAKKKIGEIKEDILLNDDEYIGEFVSIIYDKSYNVMMVQSNLYGLSTKQIEQHLTDLRFKYLNEKGKDEEEPNVVKLHPIIDHKKLDLALNADYYRKINIRGSDAMLDASLDDESLLSDARRTLSKSSGVNIDLKISIGRAPKTESLDTEQMKKTIETFRDLPKDKKPKLEITMLDNEEAEIETVNLIEPRMTDQISVEIEPRQTIGHEFLYQKMKEKYLERRGDIAKVLVERR